MSQYSFRKICSALRRYGAAGFMVCGAVSVLQRFGWNVKAMWMCDRKLGESDRSTFEAAHCRLADEGWSLRPLRYADFRRLRPLHPDLLDSHLMLQLAEAELHQGNEFVGLFDDEKLLGFGGMSFIHFAISAEPLPPGAVYLWDDFVCPPTAAAKFTTCSSPFAAKLRQSADAIVRWLWFTPSTRLRARTLRRKASAASPSGFVWSANFNAWLPGNGDAPSANIESSSCNRGQRGQRSQRAEDLLQPSQPSNSANLSALLAPTLPEQSDSAQTLLTILYLIII